MRSSRKNMKPMGLYIMGSLYPKVTGGMEIFNYFFLRHRLSSSDEEIRYWSANPVEGSEDKQVRLRHLWPKTLTHPIQLFMTLVRYGRKADYIYTGYARQPWPFPLISSLLYRAFRVPYVVTIHSGGSPNLHPAFAYRHYFKHAHTVTGVSRAICEDYGKLIHRSIQYIPPLVPFEETEMSKADIRVKLGLPVQDRILLFVGSLKGMKNPDKILQALAHLGKERLDKLNLTTVIVGGGDMTEQLKQLAQQEGLSDRVIFSGLQPREAVAGYFWSSDMYVIASDYEGTSVSLLEAMYNGLPIIAADSPGIDQMVGNENTALMYPAREPKAMARCIERLIEEPGLAGRLAGNARTHYEQHYSFRMMMDEYDKIFRSTWATSGAQANKISLSETVTL